MFWVSAQLVYGVVSVMENCSYIVGAVGATSHPVAVEGVVIFKIAYAVGLDDVIVGFNRTVKIYPAYAGKRKSVMAIVPKYCVASNDDPVFVMVIGDVTTEIVGSTILNGTLL